MDVTGTLIVESLQPDADLTVTFAVRRLYRVAVEEPADGQPGIWTLIDLTCPEADVDVFAAQPATGLARGPWYVDLHTPRWT